MYGCVLGFLNNGIGKYYNEQPLTISCNAFDIYSGRQLGSMGRVKLVKNAN